MIMTYVLLGVGAFYIIVEDVRFQKIPLKGLVLFGGAGFLKQFWEPELENICVAVSLTLILLSCYGIFSLFKNKPVMGTGDFLLGPSCGLWLRFSELPHFLIITGLFGVFLGAYWRYRWKMQTFPFGPALILGLVFTLIMRCF